MQVEEPQTFTALGKSKAVTIFEFVENWPKELQDWMVHAAPVPLRAHTHVCEKVIF